MENYTVWVFLKKNIFAPNPDEIPTYLFVTEVTAKSSLAAEHTGIEEAKKKYPYPEYVVADYFAV
jgi:hypothetical protein